MKKILLIGPPGSGKGTQAAIIASLLNIPTISTGYILREEVRSQSPLGLQIKEIIESGNLVGDQLMVTLLKQRLEQNDCLNGFILDGFPRTLSQAKTLTESLFIDYVFSFEVSDDYLVERLSGRREHPGSGRTYHVLYHPPLQENVDDVTGEPLVQRNDDKPEYIKTRLENFHAITQPVIEYYQRQAKDSRPIIKSFDATLEINALTKAIFECLELA